VRRFVAALPISIQHRLSSQARYEDLLKKHVQPKLGERPLQQIKPIEIQKFYAELTSLAPRTRHHVATVLKACPQAAVDIGKVLSVNPAVAIWKPTAAHTDVGHALQHDELLGLVQGFRGSTMFELFSRGEDPWLRHQAA
jgi:integrase